MGERLSGLASNDSKRIMQSRGATRKTGPDSTKKLGLRGGSGGPQRTAAVKSVTWEKEDFAHITHQGLNSRALKGENGCNETDIV